MPITGLDHYNLDVRPEEIDALKRFYVEVLGLRVGERPPFRRPGYWLYAGDHAVLHLTAEPDAAHLEVAQATGRLNHVALHCTDLAGTQARLHQHGIDYQVTQVPGRAITQLFFRDPAGVGVELSFHTKHL